MYQIKWLIFKFMQKSMSTRKKFKISLTVPLSFLVNENHNFKDFIWIEHLRYGIYMFFLVNSMKLRKKNQTGEKKSPLKKIRRPKKSKFWKIQLTKVWYYQNKTFVSCVFWYEHFCGLVILFSFTWFFLRILDYFSFREKQMTKTVIHSNCNTYFARRML